MFPACQTNVGIPPLVERECHHYILHLLEINLHQGLPLVNNGGQSLSLFESGNQGPMDPSEYVYLPLVEIYW